MSAAELLSPHSTAQAQTPNAADTAIELRKGPHLFLDDFLVEKSVRLARKICSPQRACSDPIVNGKQDKNFQPYVSVLRDPKSGSFRIWYDVPVNGGQSHLATMESGDGIHWSRPHTVLKDPARIIFGASIVDDGPDMSDLNWRYRFLWWNGGLWLAHSPDGLAWTADHNRPVLTGMNDIVCLTHDRIRHRYLAVFGMPSTRQDGYKGKTPNAHDGYRRCVGQSSSKDGVKWQPPRRIIKPDDRDEGVTEFYSIGGVMARGTLLIGLLKVLRDDLGCDAGGPAEGIGYTALAWTRDGENWHRDREPFFDRNPEQGTWDHAMAWMDCQLLVSDDLYLYYGGYARGHKVERFTERQIGLVRMKRDRYVSRDAGDQEGTLRTRKLKIVANAMTLNVDARKGTIRAQLVNANGKPITGFTFAECKAITSDALNAPVQWKRSLKEVQGETLRLELALRRAKLFAFDLK